MAMLRVMDPSVCYTFLDSQPSFSVFVVLVHCPMTMNVIQRMFNELNF